MNFEKMILNPPIAENSYFEAALSACRHLGKARHASETIQPEWAGPGEKLLLAR
jgi:hypothetical protein